VARKTPMANPPESIKSGNYGHPPKWTWWLKQSFLYFIGLMLMKLCVAAIFQLLPWIAWVGDWALKWTEGNKKLQIAFVMFIFPVIMNALQYYIIDSFIKEKTESGHEEDGTNDRDRGEHQPLNQDDPDNFDPGSDAEDEPEERRSLKEVNPTPIPAEGSSSASDVERDNRKKADVKSKRVKGLE
jgi:hypothetical protein